MRASSFRLVSIGLPVLMLLACLAYSWSVPAKTYIHMDIVDKFKIDDGNGQQVYYYIVSVNGYDSTLFKKYSSAIYHREVPDSIEAKVAVQMNFFFYKENALADLSEDKLMQMAHGDPRAISRLNHLKVDSSGYFIRRFSTIYSLFGQDSLYLVPGDVIVPTGDIQLKDFFTQQKSNQHSH